MRILPGGHSFAIGRARNWSLGKTLSVTALCGAGHVLGSIALGLVGIGLGLAVGAVIPPFEVQDFRGAPVSSTARRPRRPASRF